MKKLAGDVYWALVWEGVSSCFSAPKPSRGELGVGSWELGVELYCVALSWCFFSVSQATVHLFYLSTVCTLQYLQEAFMYLQYISFFYAIEVYVL